MAINPLAAVTDEQLTFSMLMLALSCGKSHTALREPRRQVFCFLGEVLKVEADLRGLPTPVAPYHAPPKSQTPPLA